MENSDIKLYNEDCIKKMRDFKNETFDLIFADPPYNLSGDNNLTVKNGKISKLNKGDWDIIDDIDEFNCKWISECIRILKNDGTIWISGTLHNYPSVAMALKKYNMWIINDIIWYKRNATPLLSRNRFVPSTELIWLASKTKKYNFNYDLAKEINGSKQMKNLWDIPATRHKTIHPTEKPEILLDRIIRIGSKERDLILDPFMGSGTTGAVAKKLNRKFVGIEINSEYFDIAKNRIFGGLI